MINRIYIKDCLSFKEIDLEFKEGLNVFTGPSGAGKSILMQAILSLFGLSDVKSSLGEVLISNSNIRDEVYDLQNNDDIIIKRFTPFKLSPRKLVKKVVVLGTTKRLVDNARKDTPIPITIKAYAKDEPERVVVFRKTVFVYPRSDKLK